MKSRGTVGFVADVIPLSKRLLRSTLWISEDMPTRLVWVTMLLLRNRNHIVKESVPGLADQAKVTLEECERALGRLKLPDKYSTSQACQGRRIQDVAGGWLIINGADYYRAGNLEARREYQREWVSDYRRAQKEKAFAASAQRLPDIAMTAQAAESGQELEAEPEALPEPPEEPEIDEHGASFHEKAVAYVVVPAEKV